MDRCENMLLVLGSDLGDRQGSLQEAKRLIGKHVGTVTSTSRIFETEPWGFSSETRFLNQAIAVCTTLSAIEVLRAIKSIEAEIGRVGSSSKNYRSRLIDIDIIYIGEKTFATSDLRVPHPLRTNRRFVLAPLADIAPEFTDPESGMTIQELLQCCADDSQVEPFAIE
jgi:2-amino-4-hydroxy-6-hydroxymethyldihydropteridine diphosphokinase